MKKFILLLFVSALSLSTYAQPDFGIDSFNIAKSFRVYDFIASPSQLFCPYDTDMINTGRNITFTWILDIFNLGNENGHLGCGDGSTSGVEYDPCRGYNKYTGFCEFSVTDKFCNLMCKTEKAYYAITTSQHYLSTGSDGYTERLAWLQRQCQCALDVTWFNSLPDTSNGTTLCPVLGPGYFDRYGPSQPGNWLRFNNEIGNFIVGETYYFEAEIYPDAIGGMVEQNVFQNESGKIPFRWNGLGSDGKYSTSVLDSTAPLPVCCSDLAPPPTPSGIKFKNNSLSWNVVSSATSYNIYVETAYTDPTKPNSSKILGWYTPPHLLTNTPLNAITIPSMPTGIYRYSVTAVNCKGESQRSETTRKDNQ